MSSVNITELRQHLPEYLRQVQGGAEIVVTQHGRPVARIVPNREPDVREAALRRLAALRGTMIVGDVVAPIASDWSGDADHL